MATFRLQIQQIWAEALAHVKKGEKLYLDNTIEKLAKAERREALESDGREGLVREYLDTSSSGGLGQHGPV